MTEWIFRSFEPADQSAVIEIFKEISSRPIDDQKLEDLADDLLDAARMGNIIDVAIRSAGTEAAVVRRLQNLAKKAKSLAKAITELDPGSTRWVNRYLAEKARRYDHDHLSGKPIQVADWHDLPQDVARLGVHLEVLALISQVSAIDVRAGLRKERVRTRGRPELLMPLEIARSAADAYFELTSKSPPQPTRDAYQPGGRPYGAFYDLVFSLFEALGVEASTEHAAKRAAKEWAEKNL